MKARASWHLRPRVNEVELNQNAEAEMQALMDAIGPYEICGGNGSTPFQKGKTDSGNE